LPTVSEAVSIAPPSEPVISIRYAETASDVDHIHQFLMIVAKPAARCPMNDEKIKEEVKRIALSDGVALMLIVDGWMVGTMGIINPTWWYGDEGFLADRWHFVLPKFDSSEASALLMDEAIKVAQEAGLEFIHQGRIRQGKKGVLRMMPRVYSPESDTVTIEG
jgi:hypothetical protein